MYSMKTNTKDAKLTIRLPADLLDNFKRYAARNNTTLTALIEAYLRKLPPPDDLDNAPIVRRLSGILSKDVSIQDYRKHLEEKYG
jgi:hypothetical protein